MILHEIDIFKHYSSIIYEKLKNVPVRFSVHVRAKAVDRGVFKIHSFRHPVFKTVFKTVYK